MRTKTMLLAGALTAIGGAAVMAQTNVYSLNAVGYINVTLLPGFNMIADQLQSGTNTIGSLFNNANGQWDKFQVYKYTGGGFATDIGSSLTATNANGWANNGIITLNPGEAAWIKNPSKNSVTNIFVGTVPQGNLTVNIAGAGGFSMISSIVPLAGDLASNLFMTNFNNKDQMFVFNPTNQQYQVFNYSTLSGNSGYMGNFTAGTGDPIIGVGQGFWYHTATTAPATAWTVNFSVNQ